MLTSLAGENHKCGGPGILWPQGALEVDDSVKDYEVVKAFVAYLRANGYPGLRVDKWPDKANRESCDIDAICGPLAIEHTSIDTAPNQRLHSDRFMKVVHDLKSELAPLLSFRLRITIEWEAVTTGQNWPAIHEALRTWILDQAKELSEGEHTISGVAGVPFQFHVTKTIGRPPGVFSDGVNLPTIRWLYAFVNSWIERQ